MLGGGAPSCAARPVTGGRGQVGERPAHALDVCPPGRAGRRDQSGHFFTTDTDASRWQTVTWTRSQDTDHFSWPSARGGFHASAMQRSLLLPFVGSVKLRAGALSWHRPDGASSGAWPWPLGEHRRAHHPDTCVWSGPCSEATSGDNSPWSLFIRESISPSPPPPFFAVEAKVIKRTML